MPKGAKSEPKINQNTIKVRFPKKVENGTFTASSFGVNLDDFLIQKRIQKSMRNLIPKNHEKHTKNQSK